MNKNQNTKQYDLEDRTLKFAKEVRFFVKKLPKTISNIEDGKQVVRSSGSVVLIILKQMNLLVKKIL